MYRSVVEEGLKRDPKDEWRFWLIVAGKKMYSSKRRKVVGSAKTESYFRIYGMEKLGYLDIGGDIEYRWRCWLAVYILDLLAACILLEF